MQQLQETWPDTADVTRPSVTANSVEADDHAQFLHILNHDLKAGLRALAELPNWVDEDLNDHGITLPSDVQDHLDMMRTSARDMLSVVDGLVDLSSAGRTPDKSERTTVEQAARRAWSGIEAEMLANHDPRPNFKLTTSEALDTIFLPRNAVSAIFKAVLENTLHHHDRDTGHVTVASETDGDRVRITIEDDGPGVPKNARRRVFDVLVMLRRREETGRAGLGLTVARKLVTKLGGEISLTKASNGRGTAVLFDLPVRARW